MLQQSAVGLAGLSSLGGQLMGKARARQPNILVFLVDDMGWQDTSVPFHTERTPFNDRYRTPSMEALAQEGVRFTNAYASCVCSPSRVSLLTGLNAARHRVTNWTLHRDTAQDARHPTLRCPEWNVNGLSPVPGIERAVHAATLPSLLRQAGYRTLHVGKAHFGALDTPGADPLNLGFDANIAGHAAGGPGSYLGTHNFSARWRGADAVWDIPGLEKYHGQDIFLTEALTLEALRLMDEAVAERNPFFLYMSHYAVHVPYAEDKRFIKRYVDAGLHPIEAQYAAIVEGMDKSLGDLMANVRRHGIADDTVVLFMSDNGGLSAHGRGGEPHTHNKPLSSGKGSAREGGVRVPMIAKWPGVTRGGTTCDEPVIIEDFLPTLMEIAGAERPTDVGGKVDGVSFVPLLRRSRPAQRDRAFHWHYPNCWGPTGPGIGPSSSIRRGEWKLIYYHADRSSELFNLADDIGETTSLAAGDPKRVRALAADLGEYLALVEAQMPIEQATGQPVPLPGQSA
jgi:arylsulfatase A-like enzyme